MLKNEINNAKNSQIRNNASSEPAQPPQKRQCPKPNVLVVDSNPEAIRSMLELLARKGIRGTIANDNESALAFLDKGSYDLVFISDKICCQASGVGQRQCGFELFEKIKANFPEMPVVMISGDAAQKPANPHQLIETVVRALRAGCYEFLIKPLNHKKIECVLDTLLPNHSVDSCAWAEDGSQSLYRIVGKSAKLMQTVNLAKKIAPTSVPVLISGESGTGKELISYLVHHTSKRSTGPYIRVNCAALSDSLLESELFGHEKGAFTGAYTQRKGRFEMAHGGTLLLDEITETPIKFQAKLLRALEQQDFERVGGNDNVRVNVRIISTTNKDLLEQVQEGRFRKDLYYRLNGVRLVICPLRQRTEDLTELVWHFINLYARETQRRITRIDSGMMDIFAKYHWPGNIRQLRNVVLTSLILGVGETLSLADVSWLFEELQPLPQENRLSTDGAGLPIPPLAGLPLEQVERQAILDTLRHTDGNQTKAAKVLGISDRTLRDRIQRYRRQGCLQSA